MGHGSLGILLSLTLEFGASGNVQAPPSDRETAGLAAEQAGQLRQAVDDYLAALQALPDPPPADADQRLRERIIRLGPRLDPPLAVSEEAHRRLIRAQEASNSAREPNELKVAASELQLALRAAPWVVSGYFILGELQNKLEDHQASDRSFYLYLHFLSLALAQDAESVQLRTNHSHGPFPVMYRYAHHALLGTGDYDSGNLTIGNGSIQFRDEAKHSFAFPLSDVRSVEGMVGRMAGVDTRAILIERKDGKKFFLTFTDLGNEELAAVEKAIKDMDSQHGIVFR